MYGTKRVYRNNYLGPKTLPFAFVSSFSETSMISLPGKESLSLLPLAFAFVLSFSMLKKKTNLKNLVP